MKDFVDFSGKIYKLTDKTYDRSILIFIDKKDFNSSIGKLNSINRAMKDFVDFSENLSCGDHLSDDQINSIKKKIASTAEREGWKNVMAEATEIIQKINSDNCIYIIDAARESDDRSVEKSLLELASNERNIRSIRTQSVFALGKIGNASTIRDLEMMSQNQRSESMRLAIKATCNIIRKRPP